jgi:hypothetical protein
MDNTKKEPENTAVLELQVQELKERIRASKLQQLETWLELHNAKSVGNKVFDGQGIIIQISKGMWDDYSILINPVSVTHNLGAGIGFTVRIEF